MDMIGEINGIVKIGAIWILPRKALALWQEKAFGFVRTGAMEAVAAEAPEVREVLRDQWDIPVRRAPEDSRARGEFRVPWEFRVLQVRRVP